MQHLSLDDDELRLIYATVEMYGESIRKELTRKGLFHMQYSAHDLANTTRRILGYVDRPCGAHLTEKTK